MNHARQRGMRLLYSLDGRMRQQVYPGLLHIIARNSKGIMAAVDREMT